MSRRYTFEFHCAGTRADRHQCRRTVSGVPADSEHHAVQAAVDAAVLGGWAPRGSLAEAPADWSTVTAYGVYCPRHA